MKLSYKELKKEHLMMQRLLAKQKKERKNALKKCKNLIKGWKYCWQWDVDAFIEDCSGPLHYLISDFENHYEIVIVDKKQYEELTNE